MDRKRNGAASRRVAVRVVLAGMVLFLIRLVYVVVVHGESCDSADFCFFSTPETTVAVSRKAGGRAFLRGAAAGVQNPAWSSREWRKAVDFYSSAFQDLVLEGFLSRDSKALCVGSAVGHEVFALKEIGAPDAIGVSRKKSPPLVVSGDLFDQPFEDETFEFIFVGVGMIESSKRPGKVAEELMRILKPGWFIVVHTGSAADVYSLSSFKSLFPSLVLVRSRETVDGLSQLKIRELVLQKEGDARIKTGISSDVVEKCVIPPHKIELVESAEPLIQEEPLKPWITLKKNAQSIKYLPSMADISFKSRYVYVDVGARSYGSSIGSWFRKRYPKQNKTFEVYAIEADEAFHAEYAVKKGITLMPFAAWVRNETLSFEVSHNPEDHDNERKGLGMGRIRSVTDESGSGHVQKIQGFDFAEWLKSTVTETDFVVMKMDVEGTEFDLLPRLFETGAICLVDELFLECHYNRWQRCCPGERSPKYQKTYEQCLDLFSSLRESGVLVHQWW